MQSTESQRAAGPPSPVTGGPTISTDRFDVAMIIERYRMDWNLDVARYFQGMTELVLYRCADTGYRFFHPASLAGEADFYDQLWSEEVAHRSVPWRHDMQFAFNTIKPGEQVVDVGCADGQFVRRALAIADVLGIDENKAGCEKAVAEGLPVQNTSVACFAQENRGKFDRVIALQVLEHVYDVRSFMRDIMALLKQGGHLSLSVPNNDPYYAGFSKYEPLNCPPHHIGLWNKLSLQSLADTFGLELTKVSYSSEPIRLHSKALQLALVRSSKGRRRHELGASDWVGLLAAMPAALLMVARKVLAERQSVSAFVNVELRKLAELTD